MSTSRIDPTTSRRALVATGLAWSAAAIPAAAFAGQATPSRAPSEDALIEAEHRRLQSLVDFDMDVALSLHADEFQLINPMGGTLSRDEYLGGLEAGFLDYAVFHPISPIDVRVYSDAAALRYQSEIEIHFGDGNRDLGTFWHTDLYEQRGGAWVAVWSQATRIA